MPAPTEENVVSELRAALLSSKTPLRIQDVNSKCYLQLLCLNTEFFEDQNLVNIAPFCDTSSALKMM